MRRQQHRRRLFLDHHNSCNYIQIEYHPDYPSTIIHHHHHRHDNHNQLQHQQKHHLCNRSRLISCFHSQYNSIDNPTQPRLKDTHTQAGGGRTCEHRMTRGGGGCRRRCIRVGIQVGGGGSDSGLLRWPVYSLCERYTYIAIGCRYRAGCDDLFGVQPY